MTNCKVIYTNNIGSKSIKSNSKIWCASSIYVQCTSANSNIVACCVGIQCVIANSGITYAYSVGSKSSTSNCCVLCSSGVGSKSSASYGRIVDASGISRKRVIANGGVVLSSSVGRQRIDANACVLSAGGIGVKRRVAKPKVGGYTASGRVEDNGKPALSRCPKRVAGLEGGCPLSTAICSSRLDVDDAGSKLCRRICVN